MSTTVPETVSVSFFSFFSSFSSIGAPDSSRVSAARMRSATDATAKFFFMASVPFDENSRAAGGSAACAGSRRFLHDFRHGPCGVRRLYFSMMTGTFPRDYPRFLRLAGLAVWLTVGLPVLTSWKVLHGRGSQPLDYGAWLAAWALFGAAFL